MKSSLLYPCRKLLKKILEVSPPRKLGQRATLIYEGQVPNVALFLVKGSGELHSKSSEGRSLSVQESCVICLNQLIEDRVAKADVILEKGAEISFLDKRGAQKLFEYNCLDEVKS